MKTSKARAWSQALDQAFPPTSGEQHTIQHEEFWDNAMGYMVRIRVLLRLSDRVETVFLYAPDLSLPVSRVVEIIRDALQMRASWFEGQTM